MKYVMLEHNSASIIVHYIAAMVLEIPTATMVPMEVPTEMMSVAIMEEMVVAAVAVGNLSILCQEK